MSPIVSCPLLTRTQIVYSIYINPVPIMNVNFTILKSQNELWRSEKSSCKGCKHWERSRICDHAAAGWPTVLCAGRQASTRAHAPRILTAVSRHTDNRISSPLRADLIKQIWDL